MKKKILFSVAATFMFATLLVGHFRASAQDDLNNNRNIIIIMCYSGEGTVVGIGNTCSDGTNNCIPNFCN